MDFFTWKWLNLLITMVSELLMVALKDHKCSGAPFINLCILGAEPGTIFRVKAGSCDSILRGTFLKKREGDRLPICQPNLLERISAPGYSASLGRPK